MSETTSGPDPGLERAPEAPESSEPPARETSEELDVEGPNESAPGHNPETESEGQ